VELHDVDLLGWDDWQTEIKYIGNETRGCVVFLWILLVVVSSICSLRFVSVPLLLNSLSPLEKFGLWALCALIAIMYFYALFRFFDMSFCVLCHYHHLGVRRHRLLASGLSLIVIAACVIASFYFHSP
jgi:hypothetical protein